MQQHLPEPVSLLPCRTRSLNALLVALALLFTPALHAVEWGVAGHSRVGAWPVYRDTAPTQHLDLLNSLGGKYYRMDGRVTADVKPYVDLVLNNAVYADIRIIPIIYCPFGREDMENNPNGYTNAYFYDQCKAYATDWVNYWGQNGYATLPFEAIEIHNELDLVCINSGVSGSSVNHYDAAKFGRVAAVIRGLCDGVRAAHPAVPRMVGCAGWYHYGFTDKLIAEFGGPLWEINVYHWYSEMGLISTRTNVIAKLQSYVTDYNMPTWVTEVDCRNGSLPGSGETAEQAERRHAETLANLLHDMKQFSFIHRICVYELLDEPYRSGGEAHYGMFRMQMNASGKWEVAGEKTTVTSAYRSAARMDHNTVYELAPLHAGSMRLHVNGTSPTNGVNVDITADADASNQRWKAQYAGLGDFEFAPMSAQTMRLDVNQQGTTSGTNVHQYSANGAPGQFWWPMANSDGSFKFAPGCAPGLRLDVAGSGAADHTNVQIWNPSGNASQRWRLLNYSTRQWETESLFVRSTSGEVHRVLGDPALSEGQGTSFLSNGVSDYSSYILRDVAAGEYNVKVRVKTHPSRGIVQLVIGRADDYAGTAGNVGLPQDLYSASSTFVELDLGVWAPGTTSDKEIRFVVTGKNAASTGYTMVIDYIKLIPIGSLGGNASITIEAEDYDELTSPMVVDTDSSASGGEYVRVSSGFNSGSSAPDPGWVEYDFYLEDPETVDFWVRARASTTGAVGTNNSFWFDLYDDGAGPVAWDMISSTTWTWYKWTTKTLPPGDYRFRVHYREDGAFLDKVFITADGSLPQ